MLDIAQAAGQEVVNAYDTMTLRNQCIAKMRTKKSCSSSN